MTCKVLIINTPSSRIAEGATIIITWVYTSQTNAISGILSCIDNTTQSTTVISNTINLASQSYSWTVKVPPSTYYLTLNDGSDKKYTGTFTVFSPLAPSGTALPPSVATSPATSTPIPAQTTPNIGIYFGVAIGGFLVGILSFAGYRVYKKYYQNSNFIPTP
ncbi:5592_t:CDS:2, partial [Scutellospora calospora]